MSSNECAQGEYSLTLLKNLASVEVSLFSEAHPHPAGNTVEKGNSDICSGRKVRSIVWKCKAAVVINGI